MVHGPLCAEAGVEVAPAGRAVGGLLLNAAMAAMNSKVMGNRFGSRPCRSGKAVFA